MNTTIQAVKYCFKCSRNKDCYCEKPIIKINEEKYEYDPKCSPVILSLDESFKLIEINKKWLVLFSYNESFNDWEPMISFENTKDVLEKASTILDRIRAHPGYG